MADRQTCILVLGMHRSGTSALTGVLSLLDVYLGDDLMMGTSDNTKGYFENNTIYEINENILAEISTSWEDVFYNENKLDTSMNIEPLKKSIDIRV